MKESDKQKILFSGSSIAKNTVYNLLGYGIPLIVALIFIPILVNGLGKERFGILNLIWIVIGYFGFFDFGIGRTLTKIIAEKIGLNKFNEISSILWTSLFIMLIISLFGTIILMLNSSILVYNFFNISSTLQEESLHAFYLLSFAIPVITVSAGLRGVLEAYQKFGVINIIRTILGFFTFLGPALCLIFTNNLFYLVLILVIMRVLILLLYLNQCFKLNISVNIKSGFNFSLIKPILKLSSWMTISNFVNPAIVYIDRFMIGALISATAVTYYSTPYEVVTKLLLIPGALTAVLFPAFSANYLTNSELNKKLVFKAGKYIFIIIFPITLLIVTFSKEVMNLWLGASFLENSSTVLQLLTIGVLVNSISFIPFTFLQGIGRPDITAKIHMVEFPVYILAMWVGIKQGGINGAALVWLIRIIIDAFVLALYTNKIIFKSLKISFNLRKLIFIILVLISIFPILIEDATLKIASVMIELFLFILIMWNYILEPEEKLFFISHIKIFTSKFKY